MTDSDWTVEDIPHSDVVYYRVHTTRLLNGLVRGNCFRERGNAADLAKPRSLSTDWARYATPAATLARAARPEDNIVVALTVGDVRHIEEVSVQHSPIRENRSHTDVVGVGRDPEIRDRLHELADIVLQR